jgi:hypothetical protein
MLLHNKASTYAPLDWCDQAIKLYQRLYEIKPSTLDYATDQFLKTISQWDSQFPPLYKERWDTPFLQVAASFKTSYARGLAADQFLHLKQGVAMIDATAQSLKDPNTPKTDGSQRPHDKNTCIYGLKHPLKQCYILNPELRPQNWTPKRKWIQVIQDALRASPKRQRGIERIIGHPLPQEVLPSAHPSQAAQPALVAANHYAPSIAPSSQAQPNQLGIYQSNPTTASTPSNPQTPFNPPQFPYPPLAQPLAQPIIQRQDDDMTSFLASPTSFAISIASMATALPYQNWWILDTGSGIHITNNRDYFSTYTALTDQEQFTVQSGTDGRATAIGRGSVPLVLTRPDGSTASVNISNVYYVPRFLTNIISSDALEDTYGLYHHAYSRTLQDSSGVPRIRLEKAYKQVIIAKTVDQSRCQAPIAVMASSYDAPHPSPASYDVWHARLGHPHQDVMTHLIDHTDAKIVPRTTSGGACEVCRHAKATQKISRVPQLSGSHPMDIIHFDYVHLPIALNGTRYMLHLYDTYSAYHVIYPMATRHAEVLQPIIIGFVKWTLNHGWLVRRLHSDDDPSLKGLGTTLQHRGIKFTQSTAYNHEQNGFGERSGGVIIIVLRSTILHAGLPEAL